MTSTFQKNRKLKAVYDEVGIPWPFDKIYDPEEGIACYETSDGKELLRPVAEGEVGGLVEIIDTARGFRDSDE